MNDNGLKLALSLAGDDLELIVEYLDRFADVDDGQSNEAMRALCATKRIKNLHERIAAGGWLPKNELSYRLDQAAGQVVRESCPSTAHAGVPVVAPASLSASENAALLKLATEPLCEHCKGSGYEPIKIARGEK